MIEGYQSLIQKLEAMRLPNELVGDITANAVEKMAYNRAVNMAARIVRQHTAGAYTAHHMHTTNIPLHAAAPDVVEQVKDALRSNINGQLFDDVEEQLDHLAKAAIAAMNMGATGFKATDAESSGSATRKDAGAVASASEQTSQVSSDNPEDVNEPSEISDNALFDRVENLVHWLRVTLPMAKGYAFAHQVGTNLEKVAEAAEVLCGADQTLEELRAALTEPVSLAHCSQAIIDLEQQPLRHGPLNPIDYAKAVLYAAGVDYVD